MNVRVSPEEKDRFQKAAELASLSLSEWVRKVLIAAAKPVKPSEPGEGVLRMEKGKYVPILPQLPAEPAVPAVVEAIVPEHFNNPLAEGTLQRKVVPPFQVTQLPVTAPPPPPVPEPLPEPVVTPAPARPMSMVDRMYAIIEARDGKEKADFWLLTNSKRK